MRLVYYRSDPPNVGDALNAWMWPELLPGHWSENPNDTAFLGIGSILAPGYTDQVKRGLVFGSGARGLRHRPHLHCDKWDIRFVRGPLTSKLLGGVPYITDPAVLAPLVSSSAKPTPHNRVVKGRIGFVPYYKTPPALVRSACHETGLHLISPSLEPSAFIAQLRSCEAVVAEAMHGAILADSFRVPWRGIRLCAPWFEGPTARFKWFDWLDSLHISRRAIGNLPAFNWLPSRLRHRLLLIPSDAQAIHSITHLVAEKRWFLSDGGLLANAQDKILTQLSPLKLSLSAW